MNSNNEGNSGTASIISSNIPVNISMFTMSIALSTGFTWSNCYVLAVAKYAQGHSKQPSYLTNLTRHDRTTPWLQQVRQHRLKIDQAAPQTKESTSVHCSVRAMYFSCCSGKHHQQESNQKLIVMCMPTRADPTCLAPTYLDVQVAFRFSAVGPLIRPILG
jgi:hypothetical protein